MDHPERAHKNTTEHCFFKKTITSDLGRQFRGTVVENHAFQPDSARKNFNTPKLEDTPSPSYETNP